MRSPLHLKALNWWSVPESQEVHFRIGLAHVGYKGLGLALCVAQATVAEAKIRICHCTFGRETSVRPKNCWRDWIATDWMRRQGIQVRVHVGGEGSCASTDPPSGLLLGVVACGRVTVAAKSSKSRCRCTEIPAEASESWRGKKTTGTQSLRESGIQRGPRILSPGAGRRFAEGILGRSVSPYGGVTLRTNRKESKSCRQCTYVDSSTVHRRNLEKKHHVVQTD